MKKKKRQKLYTALTDATALAQAKAFYEEGLSGMEAEFFRYMEAASILEQCGIPPDRLMAEKAELYEQLAQINRDIRAARKQLGLCREIQSQQSQMERAIERIEFRERENHIGHRER